MVDYGTGEVSLALDRALTHDAMAPLRSAYRDTDTHLSAGAQTSEPDGRALLLEQR